MEQLISWLIFLVTFLIGYFLGQGKITQETIVKVKQSITKAFNTSRVGAIRTPTARDVYLKKNPILKEGMDAMKEDLDKKGL